MYGENSCFQRERRERTQIHFNFYTTRCPYKLKSELILNEMDLANILFDIFFVINLYSLFYIIFILINYYDNACSREKMLVEKTRIFLSY